MKKTYMGGGFVRYEKSEPEKLNESLLRLARIQIRSLSDDEAATVAELFDEAVEGAEYKAGDRVRGKDGRLYKFRSAQTLHKLEELGKGLFSGLIGAVSSEGREA